jgi:hypothetical protein
MRDDDLPGGVHALADGAHRLHQRQQARVRGSRGRRDGRRSVDDAPAADRDRHPRERAHVLSRLARQEHGIRLHARRESTRAPRQPEALGRSRREGGQDREDAGEATGQQHVGQLPAACIRRQLVGVLPLRLGEVHVAVPRNPAQAMRPRASRTSQPAGGSRTPRGPSATMRPLASRITPSGSGSSRGSVQTAAPTMASRSSEDWDAPRAPDASRAAQAAAAPTERRRV